MSTTASLYGGIRQWDELHAAAGGWTGIWQDSRGFHVEALPEDVPHWAWLWAWSPEGNALLRARIDGTWCYTAVLALSDGETLGLAREGEEEYVCSPLQKREKHSDAAVRQYKGPDGSLGGMGAGYLSVRLPDLGDGGLSFYVPDSKAHDGWKSEITPTATGKE